MCLLKSFSDLGTNLQDLIQRQWSLGQSLRQSLPLKLLHDQVIQAFLRADVVQGADVRMIQR